MRGKVIQYDQIDHTGIISGIDGKRYRFILMNWNSMIRPRVGLDVDFEANDGEALGIITLETLVQNKMPLKSRSTYILLGFFLGGLGIHNFYAGRVLFAIIQLIFSWTLIPIVWAFFEIIFVKHDGNGNKLV